MIPDASDNTASAANRVWRLRTLWSTSHPPAAGPSAKPSDGLTPNSEMANPTRPCGVAARRAVSMTPVFPSFTLGENNTLKPAASPQAGLASLKSGQIRRCPGAATQPAGDGSAPFVDNGLLTCDPLQTP